VYDRNHKNKETIIAIDPGHGLKGSNNATMDPGSVGNLPSIAPIDTSLPGIN
jgi:N-acetylmuramoyl-L-alanine amidase